jgi:uncharacterized membrane protein YgcG
VDQFAWTDPKTLRWRSRLPSDPPFDSTELIYEISYTLSGILVKQANRYLLDHDFAFPNRAGTIEKFTLQLSLDPAWKPEGAVPATLERRDVRPGEGVVVRVPLAYVGSGRPAAGRTVTSGAIRLALFAILAAATALLYLAFRAREKALGRFAPLPAPDSIDEGWLETNLLSLGPEEAGALWDEKIGPPEVSAVLARLASEKKIATRVEGKKLVLRRLVPLDELRGYDHDLVKALFFGGREETDTDAIRKHYKSRGFDPASKIRSGLEQKLARHADFRDKAPRPSRAPTAVLWIAGIAALALSATVLGESVSGVIGVGVTFAAVYGLGLIGAFAFQKRVDRLDAFSPIFLWVPVLLLYFAWSGFRGGLQAGLALSVGTLLLRLGIIHSIFNIAKTRNGPRRIARRKALAATRAFFARELERATPRLKDEWFPYVVAFGLTGEADRWFRAHGASGEAAASGSSGGGTSSTSSTGSGSWTGGGGAFGGAGASAGWAVAAGGLASGVSAPSSGGGGGGGGGGGSSGGGGGGGW